MASFQKSNPKHWQGRKSDSQLYLHEKVECNVDPLQMENCIIVLGYASDEGVKRNQGRIGAVAGPDAIRLQLGKMPNHLRANQRFVDLGTIDCLDGDMEASQDLLSEQLAKVLDQKSFPIVLGGGHDIAYGHFNGIQKYLGNNKTIGIINFDAHFDLRDNSKGNNSGTPFYQIALNSKLNTTEFNYLCLGIRQDANDASLFKAAKEFGVTFIENVAFNMQQTDKVQQTIRSFIEQVDVVYVTLDLDGFSSAYAPGVSAPSPMGFSPDIVLASLNTIIESRKMISLDLAEMNPTFDVDQQTAKLAASLVHYVMHRNVYNQL